jgi:hypothetical protein
MTPADVTILMHGGGIMRMMSLILVSLLSACTGAPPTAAQRAAAQDDLNPSGRPYVGPPGIVSSAPPADPSFSPLRCHPEGPGEVCNRDSN